MEKHNFDDDSSSASTLHRLLGGENEEYKRSTLPRKKWCLVAFVLNCTLLVINTALLTVIYEQRQTHEIPKLPSHDYTAPAIQWELRPMDDVFHDHESPFRGTPRPELDAAWQNLMKGFDLRVPHPGWATPTHPNNSMVKLNDGSNDGLAVPTALHEIHCLRTIRESFFPEYYPITAKRYPHEPREMNVHLDHCIDGLRQAAMCHADMTLMTYEWWDRTPYPQVVHGSPHVCANWDKLTNWVQNHNFNSHGDILVHPKTGVIPHPWNGTDPWIAHSAYWQSRNEPWNMGHANTEA